MASNQFLHECEPDSRTLVGAASRAWDAMESIENTWELLGRDPNSRVTSPVKSTVSPRGTQT